MQNGLFKIFCLYPRFSWRTKEQYEQVIAKTSPDGKVAAGGVFHLASIIDKAVKVIDVWESKEAFDTFMTKKLGPALFELRIQA